MAGKSVLWLRLRIAGRALVHHRRRLYFHSSFLLVMALGVTLAVTGVFGAVSPSFIPSSGFGSSSQAQRYYINDLRSPALLTDIEDAHYLVQNAIQTQTHVEDLNRVIAEMAMASSFEGALDVGPSEPTAKYVSHIAQSGDSIGSIAELFGVDPMYILWNNTEVSADPNLLLIGQEISVPTVGGLIYEVRLGDTISEIASRYDVAIEDILEFAPNKLSSADAIIEGLVLLLPGAVQPSLIVGQPQPGTASPPPAPLTSTGFIWPISGGISSHFGESRGGGYHSGLDIDGYGRYGAPVGAAASGNVVLVSWQGWGYGNHIIIRHPDGSEALYGHLSDLHVGQGQVVGQGEVIGTLGCTGYCTGTHLHFEIIIGGVPHNPLGYLP